ncbi:MAG: DUF4363 family protein [Clostridia bacterium]|nr:DUF4363 family protein [Clostridia bacterium]
MVKSIISIVVVSLIILVGAIYESNFVSRQFKEFDIVLNVLYEKIDDQTAVEEDVIAVQKNWQDKKRFLHAFIPHNEIKEIDLWVSEAVTLVRDEKWEDALSKVNVLINLTRQIPNTFRISFDNIF